MKWLLKLRALYRCLLSCSSAKLRLIRVQVRNLRQTNRKAVRRVLLGNPLRSRRYNLPEHRGRNKQQRNQTKQQLHRKRPRKPSRNNSRRRRASLNDSSAETATRIKPSPKQGKTSPSQGLSQEEQTRMLKWLQQSQLL